MNFSDYENESTLEEDPSIDLKKRNSNSSKNTTSYNLKQFFNDVGKPEYIYLKSKEEKARGKFIFNINPITSIHNKFNHMHDEPKKIDYLDLTFINSNIYEETETNLFPNFENPIQEFFPIIERVINYNKKKEEIFKIKKEKILAEHIENNFLFPKGKKPLESIENEFTKEKQEIFLNKKRKNEKTDKETEIKRDNNKREDNMRRKIITSFLNKYLTNRMNQLLKKENCNDISFGIFPKIFTRKVANKKYKEIKDMNLEQLYLNKEICDKKKDLEKLNHNLEVINKIKSDKYKKIRETIKFDSILNMNFCIIFQEYLKSEDFIEEINKLKKKYNCIYIANYIKYARVFVQNYK